MYTYIWVIVPRAASIAHCNDRSEHRMYWFENLLSNIPVFEVDVVTYEVLNVSIIV